MPIAAPDIAIRLPLGRLALATSGGALLTGVVLAGLSMTRMGFSAQYVLAASVVVTLSAMLAVSIQAAIGPRDPATVPLTLILGSMARMIISVALGIGLYIMLDAEPRPYWIGFMLASLVALGLETVVALGAMRQLGAGQETDRR